MAKEFNATLLYYYPVLCPSLPRCHSPLRHGSTADFLLIQVTPLGHNWPPSKLETIRKEFCLCMGRSGNIDIKHQKHDITSLSDEYPSKFQDFWCLPEYTKSLRLEEAVGGLELSGWSAVNEPPLKRNKKNKIHHQIKMWGTRRVRFCEQLTSQIWHHKRINNQHQYGYTLWVSPKSQKLEHNKQSTSFHLKDHTLGFHPQIWKLEYCSKAVIWMVTHVCHPQIKTSGFFSLSLTLSQNLPKHVLSLHWRSTWTLPHMLSFPRARITWKQIKVLHVFLQIFPSQNQCV